MKFYRLATDEGRRKKYAFPILVNEYPKMKIECSVCGRKRDKNLLLEENSQMKFVLSNNYYADFMSFVPIKLLSERAKIILEAEGVSGYRLLPMNIIPRSTLSIEDIKELRGDFGHRLVNKIPSDNLPKYYRLVIDVGAVLHPKTEGILAGFCEICGYHKYKMYDPLHGVYYIDRTKWNGNDIFGIREFPRLIHCSDRFKSIYEKHNLTGLVFDRVPAE